MENTFTFSVMPVSVTELEKLPEYSLDTPYKTAALAMAVLLCFENDAEGCYSMLDALRGPDPMSNYAKSFIRERIAGKAYKVRSFFKGASVENGYTPSQPYTITVSDMPSSFAEENWAVLYVKSSGADSPRPLKFRRKPSADKWYLNDIMCLSDIREPAAEDPWA